MFTNNPHFNNENRSSGLETGQQKINAIADDELPNLILNWSKEPTILFLKWCQCYHLSCDAILLPSHEMLIPRSRMWNYIQYRYLFAGQKLNKTENEREKNSLFLRYCLQQMNATG